MQLAELLLLALGVAFVSAFVALVARKAAVGTWWLVVMIARGFWWLTIGWWFRQLWLRYVG